MNEEQWNKIFSMKTLISLTKITKDDLQETNKFVIHVKEKVDIKTMAIMISTWQNYEESKQVNIAIKFVGAYQASRFLALLDYLSVQFRKGELW